MDTLLFHALVDLIRLRRQSTLNDIGGEVSAIQKDTMRRASNRVSLTDRLLEFLSLDPERLTQMDQLVDITVTAGNFHRLVTSRHCGYLDLRLGWSIPTLLETFGLYDDITDGNEQGQYEQVYLDEESIPDEEDDEAAPPAAGSIALSKFRRRYLPAIRYVVLLRAEEMMDTLGYEIGDTTVSLRPLNDH